MNKQEKVLSFLTNISAFLCLFFVFFLRSIEHYNHIWIFFCAAVILISNNWLIQKKKTKSAFIVFAFITNSLLLIFDVGYTSPVNSYVFYFPLLLANFLLTRYDQRRERILIMSYTILCLVLTNFTTLTPRLAAALYEDTISHVKVISIVNIVVSLFCSVVVLYIINNINNNEEKRLLEIGNKIRRAEERWSYALSNNREGVWDFDVLTQAVYYSPQWKKMLGYSDSEIENRFDEWDKLLHPEDLEIAKERVRAHFRGETPFYENMVRMRCKDGSYKWIFAKGKICEYDNEGKPKRFIGTHTDITEQKLAQEALIQSQQFLNSINQNIDVAICRTSKKDNKLLYVNRGYVKLFGYENNLDALQATPCAIYDNKEDRTTILNLLEEKGSFSDMEVKYKRKDGQVFWGLLSSTRSVDENGNVNYDGAVRDITQLKEIEHELIQAKEQAENASIAKSQFLSTMSHEIRTPMNTVIGIGNLLMQENPRPDQIENLNALKFSAESMLTLINNILDFSKIEAGKVELEQVPVDMYQLLSSIIHSHNIEAKRKGLELHLTTSIKGTFLTDPTRVSQILNNLITNAIKFTEKGSVHIDATEIEREGGLTRLKFTVKDTGIGIDQDKIDHIFERFNQENKDTSRKFGGTGLGLSITKLLLELMNSKIEIQTEKGVGTTFTFILELESDNPKTIKTIQPVKQNLEGMKILLVDDNEMNILLVNKFLKRWAISVDIVFNGFDAIKKAQENVYDLVLMDLHMPEMDGFQTTITIREFNKTLPIFALTADAFADTKVHALECGMNDFISKPFNPNELYNKIAQLYLISANS